MATLTIEGIPAGLLSRLASAAVANGRCVNSEVILSLVHHVRERAPRDGCGGADTLLCPLARWLRSGVSPGINTGWGDPG